MANSRIYLKSEAGGTTVLSRDTSANSGNLVLPASGNVASVDTAVTDNAIARFDSTTGKLQNSGVVIDDNGNVGIGTGNPIDKLTLYSASGNLFSRSQSGTSTLLTGVYSDGTTCVNSLGNYPLILLTNNAEKMRIDTNGNVGIGVTPSAWGSSWKSLDLLSSSITSYATLTDPYTIISNNAYISGSSSTLSSVYKNNGSAQSYNQGGGAHFWRTAPSGTAGNAITWTNAMTLDANGNLLLIAGTGALGYGTGAGGTVTQLTSKSTAVTLNKPSGTIITSNSALSAGATVSFAVNNSLISVIDTIIINCNIGNYRVVAFSHQGQGTFTVSITNITGVLLSETLYIDFAIIKGANS